MAWGLKFSLSLPIVRGEAADAKDGSSPWRYGNGCYTRTWRDSRAKAGAAVESPQGSRNGFGHRRSGRGGSIITQTLETSDVRAEKVAAARERLDRGDYKDPGNIAKTAGKLLKYLG